MLRRLVLSRQHCLSLMNRRKKCVHVLLLCNMFFHSQLHICLQYSIFAARKIHSSRSLAISSNNFLLPLLLLSGKYAVQETLCEVGCSISFPLHSKTGNAHVCLSFFFPQASLLILFTPITIKQVIEDMSIQTNVPALAMEEVSDLMIRFF